MKAIKEVFALFVTIAIGLALLALASCMSEPVYAQEVPAIEATAGLAVVPAVHTTPAPNETYVFPEGPRRGFYGSAHIPLNDVVGVEVQGSRTAAKAVDFPQWISSSEYFAGLRFSDREIGKHVVLYFNTLIGEIHRPVLLSYTGTRVSFEGGAGANIYFSKHVGLNVTAAYASPFLNRQFEQVTVRFGVALK